MLCLVNILTRIVSAYFFLIAALTQFALSIVVIYYGYYIQEELAILSFSSFLSKEIQSVASIAAITAGSISLSMSILCMLCLILKVMKQYSDDNVESNNKKVDVSCVSAHHNSQLCSYFLLWSLSYIFGKYGCQPFAGLLWEDI
jgi:hypothetical protein